MPQELPSARRYALSKFLKVGVLLGGNSSERKISLRSGRAVLSALKRTGFKPAALDPRNRPRFLRGLRQIDLAFIALHGHGGEDGRIQQELGRRRIPYVGSDPAGCRASFFKDRAKRLFVKKRIPTPDYQLITLNSDWRRRLARFPAPFFVKPVDDGSSIGVFCVEDFKKSAEKLRKALKRYGRLIVEKKIEGGEYTVGILQDKPLPVIEVRPKRAFYDFRAKYTKGMTEYLAPAPISKNLAARLKRLAVRVHRALGLRDFCRVDFMVDRGGRPYVLEANAIPGFTELSLLPKAARCAGISFEMLCYRLIEQAYSRKGR